MENKLTKNFFYILAYQFVTILTPLFTTPYVSRVLGPKMIGIDAYIYSFVQLFLLIVLLGLPNYASKKIAQTTTILEERTVFSELFSFQIIMTIVTVVLYGLFIATFKEFYYLLILYVFTLVSTGIDTSWYFVGKEKISHVMSRNIAVRCLNVIAIFLFVNTRDDLWIFILINGISLFLGQLVTGSIALKQMKGFTFYIRAIKKHMYPIMILFIIPCMTVVSLSVSKILLESWNGTIQVGMYNQAFKLYTMIISFISASTSVLMPRMSRYFKNNKHQQIKRYLHFSIRLICATAIPLTAGIILVSRQFVPLFLGTDFIEVAPILSTISISFVLKGLVDVFGIQYLVVSNRNKGYAFAVIVGTVGNLVICYLLLSMNYQALSLAIGLLIGTLITLIIELILAREAYSFEFLMICCIRYGLFSVIMGTCMQFIAPLIVVGEVKILLVRILIGVVTYVALLIFSRDPLIKFIKKRGNGDTE